MRANTTARQLKVSQDVSKSLDRYSAQIKRLIGQLQAIETSLSEGLGGWARWVEQQPITDNKSLSDFVTSLQALIVTMGTTGENTQTYIDSINGNKGASQSLNAAIDRHIRLVEIIQQTNAKMRDAYIDAIARFEKAISPNSPCQNPHFRRGREFGGTNRGLRRGAGW
jgi:hypothetical protein